MSTYRPRLSRASLTGLGGGGLAAVLGFALLSAGPAGAATTLGGFTVSALAEASTATYDQPNAPIPATPTVELDEGYAATSDNYGPTGSATASSLYPGQVLANAGPELGSFVPGVPLPAAPVWPIQAASTYPETPSSAADDQPGVSMDSTSTATGNTATAQLGNAPSGAPAPCAAGAAGAGSGLPSLPTGLGGLPSLPAAKSTGTGTPAGGTGTTGGLAASSAVAQIQGSSGTSFSGTVDSVATASATATDSCVSILGGLITIGSVTSTATATSDGAKAQLAGSTTVQNATVAGQAVTIDSAGIHAAGQSTPSNPVLATLQQTLAQLGVTLTVTEATDTVTGPQASRQLDGLRVQVDLTTLDKAADQFSALLPPTVTAELPVPVPNKQVLVWDLGTVDVKAAASPAFTTPSLAGSGTATTAARSLLPATDITGTGAALGTGGTAAFAGSVGATATGSYGTTGTSGTSGTGTATGATGSGKNLPATTSASSVPLAFKGIGAGLVLLGLLAAAVLGYASMRAGSAAGALPGGTACDLGDDEPPTDEGGEQ